MILLGKFFVKHSRFIDPIFFIYLRILRKVLWINGLVSRIPWKKIVIFHTTPHPFAHIYHNHTNSIISVTLTWVCFCECICSKHKPLFQVTMSEERLSNKFCACKWSTRKKKVMYLLRSVRYDSVVCYQQKRVVIRENKKQQNMCIHGMFLSSYQAVNVGRPLITLYNSWVWHWHFS